MEAQNAQEDLIIFSKGTSRTYATDTFSDDDSFSLQVVRYDFGRQVDRRRPYARGQRPYEPSHPPFRRNAGGKEGCLVGGKDEKGAHGDA